MNDLQDDRDRVAFIEYYPDYTITAVWHCNGKLDYYTVSRRRRP